MQHPGSYSALAMELPEGNEPATVRRRVRIRTGSYQGLYTAVVESFNGALTSFMTLPANGVLDLEYYVDGSPYYYLYIEGMSNYVGHLQIKEICFIEDKQELLPVLVDVCNDVKDRYPMGYQGQLKDNEWAGIGDHYEYKYRRYDPRTGRFYSHDPLHMKYPWNSTYAFAENRVIDGVDLEGGEFEDYKIGMYQSQKAMIKALDNGATNSEAKDVYHQSMKANVPFGNLPDETAKNLLRYATPIEDILGVFTGRDFDGNQYNRGEAATWASISFIPFGKVAGAGGRLLKNTVKVSRKYGDDVAKLVESTFKKEGEAKEIFTLTKSGSYKDAHAVTKDIIGDLGDDATEYVGRKGPFEGKKSGRQSADGKRGYRIDVDKETGEAHINWWKGKEKGAIPFTGGERNATSIVNNTLGN